MRLAEHNLEQNWNCLDPTKEKNYKVCQLDWMMEDIETGLCPYFLLHLFVIFTVISPCKPTKQECVCFLMDICLDFRNISRLVSTKFLHGIFLRRNSILFIEKKGQSPDYNDQSCRKASSGEGNFPLFKRIQMEMKSNSRFKKHLFSNW